MVLRLRPEAQEPGLGRRFLEEVRQAFRTGASKATRRPMDRAIETPAVH
jgi:hypothetical protein